MSPASDSPGLEARPRLAGELWGGFAAMLVALPSSIAFGVAIYGLIGPDYVGHGVRAGILGAMAIGFFAPLLGGAPRLISAPCAPAAAVLSALVAQMAGPANGGPLAPERIVTLLALVAVLCGALQIIYGFVGGGRLIKYIPYPVVAGYLSGVGVIIFLSQAPNFLGLAKGTKFWAGLGAPELWQWPSIIVGSATIAGVLLARKVTKAVPASILGLLCGTLAYFGLSLLHPEMRQLENNKLIIGAVGSGAGSLWSALGEQWSALRELQLSDLALVLAPALTLSVLLSIDTLKTCVVLDALTMTRHNSNRELMGQGAGNLASVMIGGMPGSGAMGPTMVNLDSGGRTRWSGVMEGVFVLAAAVALGRWIAWMPVAALAGILIVVAGKMFDWSCFHLLRHRETVLDFSVIACVVLVAVKVDLILASGAGLGLAILLFIREQVRGSVVRRKIPGNRIFSTQHRLPSEQSVLEQFGGETVVVDLQGSLFFGTTDQLYTELESDLKHCRYLILDLRRVRSVDFTAAHLLEQFEAILKQRDGYLIFSHPPTQLPTGRDLHAYLARVGVLGSDPHVLKFDTQDDALRWAEDRILAEHAPNLPCETGSLALEHIDLAKGVEPGEELEALEARVVERSFAAGEIIFKAGDPGDQLFLIRQGTVRIFLELGGGRYHNLASFGRGNFFGELAFMDSGCRSAQAVASAPCELYVLTSAAFAELAQTHPKLALQLLTRIACVLALRMRRADTELLALHEA